MRCCVTNCSNDTKKSNKSDGITFHSFPKEPNMRNLWVEALGMSDWEPRERSGICSEHFSQDAFYVTKCGLRRIRNGTVPVLALESVAELEAPASFRVCRICLALDVRLHHMAGTQLVKQYEQMTGIYINADDKLPKMLCWECAARLAAASRLRDKALRSHHLLMGKINLDTFMTVRDAKSINRCHNKLQSSLIMKYFGNDDSDMTIRDNEVIKIERENECTENELSDDNRDDSLPDVCALEVKDEKIFVEEYPGFVSDDDRTLSEVYKEKKVKKKKCKVKSDKSKESHRSASVTDEENPATATDKYKSTSVRRRRTNDALDETLFTITTLTYEEQIADIQKRQETNSYRSAPYKCTVCYRGFLIKDRYDAHIVRHTDQSGTFECFICKTRLKTSRALRKHLTAQHTEKYSCKGCPFATRNRGVAREHEKWHAGTKYQCPHCPSEFDKVTTYLGHIRIKHVSKFVCELCGYTFISKKGIDVHKKKKHKVSDRAMPLEGPYCAECDVRFVSEEAHDRHLKLSSQHSSDDDPNRIRNDSQSMNAERNGRVMRKIERRPVIHPRAAGELQPDAQGPVTCEQCGVQMRDLRLYAQHFRRAHPDKNRTKYPAMKTPCMCEQCGRIFQSMALLKDHMWVHTGEKRFKCDRCEKSFTQKTNLVFHMRVHSASRPTYECPVCGKHFAFYNNRRRHMFIHTGLKPFKCDTCGKSFTTAGEQRAHVEHVHLKKPWPKRARARAALGWPGTED